MRDALRSAHCRCGWPDAADVPLIDGAREDRGAPRLPGSLRPLLAICGAITFLGIASEWIGVILASAGAVLLAGLAEARSPNPAAGAVQVGLVATLGWLVFGHWLGFDLPFAPDL